MKSRIRFRIFAVLPLVLLSGLLLGRILWHLSPPHQSPALFLTGTDTVDGDKATEWVLRNSKMPWQNTAPGKNAQSRPAAMFLTQDVLPVTDSKEHAETLAEQHKRLICENGSAFITSEAIGEETHSGYRRIMEEFIGIRNTGWKLKYAESLRQVRQELADLPDAEESVSEDMPVLLLASESRLLILESGRYFDGKCPTARAAAVPSRIYEWIPIYTSASSESQITEEINLHLTDEGRRLFTSMRLPFEPPLSIRHESAFAKISFFTIGQEAVRELPTFKDRFTRRYREYAALYENGDVNEQFWKLYVPRLTEYIAAPALRKEMPDAEPVFSARGKGFVIEENGEKSGFYVKGVNLGTALPGKWATEFPTDEHLYYRWFSQIAAMNLNAVRVYTLLPPSFYRAIDVYNRENPARRLYLLQEIWPEEHPPGNNYLDQAYDNSYRDEIKQTVDAMHGNAYIPARSGRAWGDYRRNISRWILGYLIGREMEPDEVLATNALNKGKTYRGTYISAENGSPSEAWLAEACDIAAIRDIDGYGSTHPVGIVSWPTLDPARHPSEWRGLPAGSPPPANDKASIDINKFRVSEAFKGGFFGAYHIYPNYPDFMNNEASYAKEEDAKGTFRYKGYLKVFIAGHSAFPAIVAEYGISTSAASAHKNPDGLDHGGLSETMQADGIIRMTDAIRSLDYAGAVIFEWIDEWAKKTWTTESYMIPFDRHASWHNIIDPEQNYGISGFEPSTEMGKTQKNVGGFATEVWGDEAYLHIRIMASETDCTVLPVILGVDSYGRDAGSSVFPTELTAERLPPASTGMEFILNLPAPPDPPRLLALDSYNIGRHSYSSRKQGTHGFSPISMLINRGYIDDKGRKIPPAYEELGLLKEGLFDEPRNTLQRSAHEISVRIPWGLLNASDPSSGTVLDDTGHFADIPGRDELETTRSESILLYINIDIGKGYWQRYDMEYIWTKWDLPAYTGHVKKSYGLLRDYFSGY